MRGQWAGWWRKEERAGRRRLAVSGGERRVAEESEAWTVFFWATQPNAGCRLNCRKVEVRKISSLNISTSRNHRPQILLETIISIHNNNKYSILGYLLTVMPFGGRHSFILWVYTYTLGVLIVEFSLHRVVS